MRTIINLFDVMIASIAKISALFKNLWERFVDAIFPVFCFQCERDGIFLCATCLLGFTFLDQESCAYCFKESRFGLTCENCKENGVLLEGIFAMQDYDNPLLSSAIHTFKYEFIKDLAVPLSQLLYDFFVQRILAFFQGKEEIFFQAVPLHKKRLRYRGFNQAELLLRAFLQRDSPGPMPNFEAISGNRQFVDRGAMKFWEVDLLKRVKFRRAQMELGKFERKRNVAGNFEFELNQNFIQTFHKRDWRDVPVVLVDDVATTLATLEECAKTLRRAGFTKIYALVLARKF